MEEMARMVEMVEMERMEMMLKQSRFMIEIN
jgi:hypothetical protein